MSQPLGDKLLDIAIFITVGILIAGWIYLIPVLLIQWIFPKTVKFFDKINGKIMGPYRAIQKYALIIAAILFILRLIAGWLGWAPPLTSIVER